MSAVFKSSPVEYNQNLLFPGNVFDLLPKDHECYLYHDLFQQLNTIELKKNYCQKGQNAYHPRLIVSILIYAYSLGDFRKDNAQFFHNCFKQTVQLAILLGLASLGHISLDGSKFKASSSKHKAN